MAGGDMAFSLRSKQPAGPTSGERYRDVVETQTDLICRFLPDTTLTFVNDAYCRFFGKAASELIGTKFVDLVPEDHRADVKLHVAQVVATRRRAQYEHVVPGADGGVAW